jgi:hypothetical protein
MATDWRYTLDQVFSKDLPALVDVEFANRWITIVGGAITVSQKYAWNGLLPTGLNFLINFLGWFSFATKGATEDKQSVAYYATLVYDALCQFRQYIPLDKKQALEIFKGMLVEQGVPRWKIAVYAAMIALFTPSNSDWITPVK